LAVFYYRQPLRIEAIESYNELMSRFTPLQLAFKELFVGTLIYAVALGFLSDYTNLVDTKSFSSIFLAAFVLQILTSLLFVLKKKIVAWLNNHEGIMYRILTFFMVWLVMFLSKFVFIWAIDGLFGNDVNINGFFGILILAVSVTVVHKLADYTFVKLGNPDAS